MFIENRWYSKYKVFTAIYTNFAYSEHVAVRLVTEEVSPRNSSTLLNML
jgi:hypothetical protein